MRYVVVYVYNKYKRITIYLFKHIKFISFIKTVHYYINMQIVFSLEDFGMRKIAFFKKNKVLSHKLWYTLYIFYNLLTAGMLPRQV